MTRQIVLDTETTGLSAKEGHRIIEIGCIELVNRKLTGEQFHYYLQPDRPIDPGASKVHGIYDDDLVDKPRFKEILLDFLKFVEDAELIIHNAPFDVSFINAELVIAKRKKTIEQYCGVLDTLKIAKNLHPGQRNSLDALCKRYDIDNSNRQLHGALLDAQILADVYLAMTGGQTALPLSKKKMTINETKQTESKTTVDYKIIRANTKECEADRVFWEGYSSTKD